MPPVLLVVKATAIVLFPAQTTWLEILLTCAVGLTVMVKLCGVPGQLTEPLVKVGVTVMVAVTGDVPELVAVKAAILGISRRRYLEISANVAVYNDMSDIKLSVEDYIRKQNNK